MTKVVFTANLERHVPCPSEDHPGGTVCEVLSSYFLRHPTVRAYVLDEHGAVRRHVVIFLDGLPIKDRIALKDAVRENSSVHVMQALSGG